MPMNTTVRRLLGYERIVNAGLVFYRYFDSLNRDASRTLLAQPVTAIYRFVSGITCMYVDRAWSE
jgi:hypothetical protein